MKLQYSPAINAVIRMVVDFCLYNAHFIILVCIAKTWF